jgi:hypothetical protein
MDEQILGEGEAEEGYICTYVMALSRCLKSRKNIQNIRFPDSITTIFYLIEALRTRWDHQKISRLKQVAVKRKKAEENIELLTEKNKIFSTASILLRGVAGGLKGSHVASGDLQGSLVASGGRGWPLRVRSRLGGYRWPSGFADSLKGCRWLYGIMGGHGRSLPASGGCS